MTTLADIIRRKEERCRILWQNEQLRQFEAIVRERKRKKEEEESGSNSGR